MDLRLIKKKELNSTVKLKFKDCFWVSGFEVQ